jgi:hypothetical protein
MRKYTGLWAAVIALGSCSAVQPKPQCKAQPAEYAARYTMQGSPQGMCDGKILPGEILHLQYYRNKDDYAGGSPSLAIQPESVLTAKDENKDSTSGMLYSQGAYTNIEPDDSDICSAPKLSDTNVTAGMVHLTYKWSNVRMIVTPLNNGSHFGADLVRTEGDCTVTYKVSAVYPAVFCGTATKVETDPDGKPVVDDMGKPKIVDDPTSGVPDPKLCDPIPGNQISPDFALECDASKDGMSGTHLCMPQKAFPSLK